MCRRQSDTGGNRPCEIAVYREDNLRPVRAAGNGICENRYSQKAVFAEECKSSRNTVSTAGAVRHGVTGTFCFIYNICYLICSRPEISESMAMEKFV